MKNYFAALTSCAFCVTLAAGAPEQGQQPITLANECLGLSFSPDTGMLIAIRNQLTGESYVLRGDPFAVETTESTLEFSDFELVSIGVEGGRLEARYKFEATRVEVTWTLGGAHHFAEKQVTLSCAADCGVRRIVLSQMDFVTSGLETVCYRNPDFDWIADYVRAKHGSEYSRPAGYEPSRVFFGRTVLGGFFTGLEAPYDDSHLKDNTLTLSNRPSLKMSVGEDLVCEPLYLGVYRRSKRDLLAGEWRPVPAETLVGRANAAGFDGAEAAGLSVNPNDVTAPSLDAKVLPLPSESLAMTAMTASILGPPRHGLMAFACGWHSQMEQSEYSSEEKLQGDLRSLEFLASLGLDGVTDSHPWGGETAKMSGLREGDRYVPGERVQRFVEYARQLGLKVTQWPTMNNTHPWRAYGGPFRLDRPEWLRGVEGEPVGNAGDFEFRKRLANCLACEPYFAWLERIALDDALGTGLYESWCMDGDFWGTGAYFNTTLPVTCLADNHSHLAGDANYACQRQLARLIAEVRRRYPGIYIVMCRPPMDLGVWAQRNVDACFTLIESGTGASNIAGGNEIRTASRIRVHHQFFPHWLDQSLLFPSYGNPKKQPKWPSADIDFLMISALSCSPNLLLYLPSKTGIPEADMAEIRKWLAWGRENIAYLNRRIDLPTWPALGQIDGSAHILGNEGLVFLFNSGSTPMPGVFTLTEEDIGLENGDYRIVQEYPVSGQSLESSYGKTVQWEIPAETAVILRIWPTGHGVNKLDPMG